MKTWFPIWIAGVATILVVALIGSGSGWWFFVIGQAATIGVATWLLSRLPPRLAAWSDETCYRMDGSFSRRRYAREQSAKEKLRWDILAIFLLVAIVGNWAVLFVHTQLIPVPLAVDAISVFDFDHEVWKDNLRQQRIDSRHGNWVSPDSLGMTEDVQAKQRYLWQAWPIIFAIGISWLVFSAVLLQSLYTRALQTFAQGLQARSDEYVRIDVTRLQTELEVPQEQSQA